MQGKRVAGEDGFAISKLQNWRRVSRGASQKRRIVLGPCMVWTLERKLIPSRSNKPEVKTAMKTWAIVVGALIVLFCLSYLVRHPSTVDQTFAKVSPHNGAETP
jgi:hypothetical protein